MRRLMNKQRKQNKNKDKKNIHNLQKSNKEVAYGIIQHFNFKINQIRNNQKNKGQNKTIKK